MQDSRNDPEPIKTRRDVPEVHCIELHGLGSDAIADTGDGKSGYRKYHYTAAAGYGAVWVCKILEGERMTKPRRKGRPYNPGAVHDRRSHDLLRNAQVGALEVEDPMGLEPGDKIMVLRSTRDDPLARLHDRKQIDEAQYLGGRAFQNDFETAERGPQAIDPSKEFVDGGRLPEPITEHQRKAILRLNKAEGKLGVDGSAITHDVLIKGLTVGKIAESRGLKGERWEKYFGMRFRECLETLAVVYGYAMKTPENKG